VCAVSSATSRGGHGHVSDAGEAVAVPLVCVGCRGSQGEASGVDELATGGSMGNCD